MPEQRLMHRSRRHKPSIERFCEATGRRCICPTRCWAAAGVGLKLWHGLEHARKLATLTYMQLSAHTNSPKHWSQAPQFDQVHFSSQLWSSGPHHFLQVAPGFLTTALGIAAGNASAWQAIGECQTAVAGEILTTKATLTSDDENNSRHIRFA